MKKMPIDPALYDELFPRQFSKSERTKIQIIEAAIHCYATIGIDQTTYEKIAEKCDVSRPLVMRYFPEKEEIAENAIKYIRANMQRMAVNAIREAETPEAQLISYIQSTFKWIQDYPIHVKVWLLYYYYCGINDKFKTINTELSKMGHERIMALIRGIRGTRQQGTLSEKQLSGRAKMIQVVIFASIFTPATETIPFSLKEFCAHTIALCMSIAKS